MTVKILLIEDNEHVREELSELLANSGYHVTTATNGLDGYSKVQQEHFDLCVVDHLMPLMNGVNFVKNLNTMDNGAPKAVIFLTTKDLAEVEPLFAPQLGFKILAKPICQQLFLENVQQLVGQSCAVA
ncbi:response regulator [Thalassotalea aquiviva]|uniref:response regulator n=1 Tax=Thalassotalea aquiviva TaxID=3242415 RepID=UPI00352A57ED